MSVRSMIIILTVVILISGIGLFLFYHLTPAPVSQTPSNLNTNEVPGTLPTTVSVSVGQSTTTTPQFNISQSIDEFFSRLSVEKVEFTQVNSSTDKQFGSVYVLFKDDIASSQKLALKATDFSIDMAAFDLDADGTPEILVNENLPGFCGAGGCPIEIFKKKGTSWQRILYIRGNTPIGVENKLKTSLRSLLIPISGFNGLFAGVVWFVWNGTQYKSGAVAAISDGTTFTPFQ